MNKFNVKIFSPRNKIYDGDCESLIIPVKDGFYGIQANHVPVTGATVKGQVKISLNGETMNFEIRNGLFHFEDNQFILISS